MRLDHHVVSTKKMLDKMEVLEKPREKPKPYFEF
jgi:hypothetical protein